MEKQPETPSQLFSEQIQDYLGHLFDIPRTHHTYQTELHIFQKFLSEQDGGGNKNMPAPTPSFSLELIDTNVLQDFQAWLGQNEYSRFSHKTYLASVVAFLSYALSKDWLPNTFSLER